MKPFVPVTAQELVFGYDDPLVSIAHRFFPKARRPMSQMGLLLAVSIDLNIFNFGPNSFHKHKLKNFPHLIHF